MDKSEKFWDSRADKYEEGYRKYEPNFIKTLEKTKKHLTKEDIVLDFACATGVIACDISYHVNRVHGIDISSNMIDLARINKKDSGAENITFERATIADIQNKNGSYDVVLAFNIIHLLKHTPEVIQQFNELLKPGGLLITTTPCRTGKTSFSNILLFFLSKAGIVPYLKMFKPTELEKLIINGNFQLIESENLNGTPPNHFIVAKKSL